MPYIPPPPSIGWPNELTRHLDQNYRNCWAYSGSFAMYCHACRLGKECRQPQDIDILVEGTKQVFKFRVTNVFSLAGDLCDVDYGFNADVSDAGMHASKHVANNCLINGSRVKIDIAQPSVKYGDIKKCIRYKGHVVLSVHQLLLSKECAIKDFPHEAKHLKDLKVLRLMLLKRGASAGVL